MPSTSPMRHPFTPASALALALKLSAGSLALAAFAPAMAEPLNHYNIQAGPLAEVLSRYARESGVSISFETRQLASQNSNGLTGDYGVDEGFGKPARGAQCGDGRPIYPQPRAGPTDLYGNVR